MAPRGYPDFLRSLFLAPIAEDAHTNDKASQEQLLRTWLTQQYGQSLDADRIEAEAIKRREDLADVIEAYAAWYRDLDDQTKSYNIFDLFVLGPEAVMLQKLRERFGWDVSTSTKETVQDKTSDHPSQALGQVGAPSTSRSSSPSDQFRPELVAEAVRNTQTAMILETKLESVEEGASAVQNQPASQTTQQAVKQEPTIAGRSQKREAEDMLEASDGSRVGVKVQKKQKLAAQVPSMQDRATLPGHNDVQNAKSDERSSEAASRRASSTRNRPRVPEVAVTVDANWVQEKMNEIKELILNAVASYVQEYHIAEKDASEFCNGPEPELETLYEAVAGRDRWQVFLHETTAGGNCMQQGYVLMSLFGASIFRSVFRKDLPWDFQRETKESLGENEKFLAEVLADHGLVLDKMIKFAAGKQVADAAFQKSKIGALARKLTDSLVIALQPHLRLLVKKRKVTKQQAVDYDKWYAYLERAFHYAIVLKQTTTSSKLGPYEFAWPKAGLSINNEKHHKLFDTVKSTTVLHTILPAVIRNKGEEKIIFAKSLVIPAADTPASKTRR